MFEATNGELMGETELDPSDERARLNALLLRYRSAVRGFIGRRVRSPADADDLTQEVFARILRRANAGSIENVEGYLFQTATNLLREVGRQSSARGATPSIELGPELLGWGEDRDPERILLGRDAYRQMLDALLELPERTRTVFVLSRFEEIKGPEIGRRLGISVSAVEKHMMRALAHLRKAGR